MTAIDSELVDALKPHKWKRSNNKLVPLALLLCRICGKSWDDAVHDVDDD